MQKHLRAAVILVVPVFFCSCETQNQVRPAALEVRLDYVIGMKERQLRQAQMREFIWNNWCARKSATLHLKFVSKEGKETDADYEIRPLLGTIIMVVTINRARYGYQGQVFWHQDRKYDVFTVERVKPNEPEWLMQNPGSKLESVPEGANLSGADYCLRLIGWGNAVLSFF